MRRHSLRALLALLTFAAGIAANSLWVTRRQDVHATSVMMRPPPAAPAEKKRTYTGGSHASISIGGYGGCLNNISSSDGMQFSKLDIYYDSSKRALKAFRENLNQSTDVIKREPLIDEQGRKVGEKAVATFAPYEGSSVVAAKLLWAEGSSFGYVESSSLQNILEYEKDRGR